jgi:hypothetical protein
MRGKYLKVVFPRNIRSTGVRYEEKSSAHARQPPPRQITRQGWIVSRLPISPLHPMPLATLPSHLSPEQEPDSALDGSPPRFECIRIVIHRKA